MRLALLLLVLAPQLVLAAEPSEFQCSREEGDYAEKYFLLESGEKGLVSTERAVDPKVVAVLASVYGSMRVTREGLRAILQISPDLPTSKKVFRQSQKTVAKEWRFAPAEKPGQFELLGDGKSLGHLSASTVIGQENQGTLVAPSGKSYRCRFFDSDLAPDTKLDDGYAAQLAEWESFKKRQPKVCRLGPNDSFEILHHGRPAVTVLLLQGYAISPAAMKSVAEYFGGLGMNVLVPRLKGHYNINPRDLDSVKAEEWMKESEEALKIAAKMSPKVLVVGYSLGGLLGARLALKYPSQVAGFIGMSPALRLTTETSALSTIGSLFGLSANDVQGGKVESCHIYISSKGGLEVARVLDDTEQRFGGSEAFQKLKMPSLVFLASTDDTVDNQGIAAAVENSKKHALVPLLSGDHDSWASDDWLTLKSSRASVTDHIASFLKTNGF